MLYSEITLYAKDTSFGRNNPNQINFGTSGSFNPEDENSYWRIIHAASCLKNWEIVCEIVNDFCEKHRKLEEDIFEINKT